MFLDVVVVGADSILILFSPLLAFRSCQFVEQRALQRRREIDSRRTRCIEQVGANTYIGGALGQGNRSGGEA